MLNDFIYAMSKPSGGFPVWLVLDKTLLIMVLSHNSKSIGSC